MVCETLPVPTSADIDVASVVGASVAPAGAADETSVSTAINAMRNSLESFMPQNIPYNIEIVNAEESL